MASKVTSWKQRSEEVIEKLNEASIIISTGVTGFSVKKKTSSEMRVALCRPALELRV